MRTFTVCVNEETLQALDALTKAVNMPREELINQVLRETLPHLKARHLVASSPEARLLDTNAEAPTDTSR